MRVGLIDVDGHNFPNLALMRISAYHFQMRTGEKCKQKSNEHRMNRRCKMTIDRAIEILTPDRCPDYSPSEYEEALDMARAALEREVAQREK